MSKFAYSNNQHKCYDFTLLDSRLQIFTTCMKIPLRVYPKNDMHNPGPKIHRSPPVEIRLLNTIKTAFVISVRIAYMIVNYKSCFIQPAPGSQDC